MEGNILEILNKVFTPFGKILPNQSKTKSSAKLQFILIEKVSHNLEKKKRKKKLYYTLFYYITR